MEQFEEFAKLHDVTMTAQNVASRPDGDENWNKDAIHFHITLTCNSRVLWSGYYSVGSGHPLMWARDVVKRNKVMSVFGWHGKSVKELCKRGVSRGITIHEEQVLSAIKEAYIKSAPIKVADILCSLQMDVSSSDQCFSDWAADYGYSDDSIKARRIWEDCNDIRRALQSGFGRQIFDQFLQLEEV